MKKRDFGEMVSFFNRKVSEMNISRKCRMELLGMITAIEIKHDELMQKAMSNYHTERKKGEWKVQPSTGEDSPSIWWKCSECGHVIFSETERDRKEFHAFCGRCGADMRNVPLGNFEKNGED